MCAHTMYARAAPPHVCAPRTRAMCTTTTCACALCVRVCIARMCACMCAHTYMHACARAYVCVCACGAHGSGRSDPAGRLNFTRDRRASGGYVRLGPRKVKVLGAGSRKHLKTTWSCSGQHGAAGASTHKKMDVRGENDKNLRRRRRRTKKISVPRKKEDVLWIFLVTSVQRCRDCAETGGVRRGRPGTTSRAVRQRRAAFAPRPHPPVAHPTLANSGGPTGLTLGNLQSRLQDPVGGNTDLTRRVDPPPKPTHKVLHNSDGGASGAATPSHGSPHAAWDTHKPGTLWRTSI
eukprot:gene24165-biopygen1335